MRDLKESISGFSRRSTSAGGSRIKSFPAGLADPGKYNRRMRPSRTSANAVNRRLLSAYGHAVWRSPLPPVDELVSTILSQNTNDINRDRAFEALRQQFPTWEKVRDAREVEIIEAIRSAGLANQKGPRIQAVLRQITAERGAIDLEFLRELAPEDARKRLLQFKGVGPKTAAIVMLFSLGKPAFPVDTHVFRVTGRLGLRPENIGEAAAHILLQGLFPPETFVDAHLNLIRHGRQVCLARRPRCDECILGDLCNYRRERAGRQPTRRSPK